MKRHGRVSRRAPAASVAVAIVVALLLPCAVAGAAPGPAAPAAAAPALRGRVVDPDGNAVAGADVRAWAWTDVLAWLLGKRELLVAALPPESTRGTTSADGTFRIPTPERGVYALRVTASGCGVAYLDGAVAIEGGGPEIAVRCPKGATYSGLVVDEAGRPMAGVPVAFGPSIERERHGDASLLGVVTGVTDEAGRFRLEGVPTHVPADDDSSLQSFSLRVDAPSGRHYLRSFMGHVPDPMRVTVRGGLSAVGKVMRETDGAPLPGASVWLLLSEETPECESASVIVAATAAGDGSFKMPDVPVGRARGLLAFAPGFGAWSPEGPEALGIEDGRFHVDARIPSGIVLAGRALDGSGKPVAGVRVLCEAGRPGEAGAVTDAQGRYRIAGIPVPRSEAKEEREIGVMGFAPGLVLDPTSVVAKVAAGATEVAHDLVLLRAATVAGTVLDAQRKPVVGARVRVEDTATIPVRSGLDGTFVLPSVRPGSHTIVASREGREGSTAVEVAEGADVAGVAVKVAAEEEAPTAPETARPKDVQALVARLHSTVESERWDAARDLSGMGASARAAVPALLEALADPAPSVASIAANALLQIGGLDASAVPYAVHVLATRPAQAAMVLAAVGPAAKAAVPDLIRALGRPGGGPGDAEYRLGLALVAIGRDAVPALVEAMRGPDEELRGRVGVALSHIGSDAVDALLPLVKDPDAGVRLTALGALEGLWEHRDAALPVLVGALADAEARVHVAALEALGRLGEGAAPAVASVEKDLASADGHVRATAARTLGRIGPAASSAVPALVRMLDDPDDDFVGCAGRALAGIGDASAVPALSKALASARPSVRLAAVEALGGVGAPARSALPALVEACKDPEPEIRRQAAFAIATFGADARAATPTLVATIRETDDGLLRSASIEALAAVAAPIDSIPVLRTVLEKESMFALDAAVGAVRRMGASATPLAPVVLARLLRKGSEDDNRTRAHLASTLPSFPRDVWSQAVPTLVGWLAPTGYGAQQEAAVVLLELGVEAERAKPYVLAAIQEDRRDLVERAARALGTLGPAASDAVPALERLAQDRVPSVRRAAAESLGKIRGR